MLLNSQRVQLLLFGVPVRPNALEDSRPVQECVGHDRDTRVTERYVAALEVADKAVLIGLVRRICSGDRGVLGDHSSALPGAGRRLVTGCAQV